MGLWSRLKGFMLPAAGSARTMMQGIGRNTDPPTRGTQEFLETYEATPWVRAVAGKVAAEVGQTQWTLSRRDRDEPVTDHIMLRALRAPNPMMSSTALFRVTQLSLDLVGDSF